MILKERIAKEVLEQYLIENQESLKSKLNQNHLKTINYEIGCGNGHFLIDWSVKYTDHLTFGCDYDWKRIKKSIEKAEKRDLTNLHVHYGRAEEFIDWFDDHYFENIFINFPDPWPKKKHNKRRFFYPDENLKKVYQKLKKQGKLYFVSDHKEYFFFALEERLQKFEGLYCPFEK